MSLGNFPRLGCFRAFRKNIHARKIHSSRMGLSPQSVPPSTAPGDTWQRSSDSETSSAMLNDYLKRIITSPVYDVAKQTPLTHARNLSSRFNNKIMFKREDMQPVFSFKLRGAYNRMINMTQEEKRKGVVTCSAGNHAQGVALSANKLGIEATIVMPTFTPTIKVKAVEKLGGRVILHGNDFDEAKAEADRLSHEDGKLVIPPFDDKFVVAGQGTIGMEICRQTTAPDAIFVCVGGGGLIAGVGAFVKSVWPETKIIGVEAFDASAMYQSLEKGERVCLSEVGLFADGAAVRQVGEECFRVAREVVDEMILVDTGDICAAIQDVFEDTRSILEPAGALAVAGCKRYIQANSLQNKSFVCIASGANMNFNRLRFVASRAEEREALFSVIMPERPGSFQELYEILYPRNVTEFSYRFADSSQALIMVGVQIANPEDRENLLRELKKKEFKTIDVTNNNLAKDHARYLAGGRAPKTYFSPIANERIMRFQFPERPGALKNFLNCIGAAQGGHHWNVICFHYRNYGSDVGRVLCGIEVPDGMEAQFQEFLTELGYPYVEENENPVYKQYLCL